MEAVPTPLRSRVLERLKENLAAVEARVAEACARSGRAPGAASLLAVVKYVSAEMVALLAEAGVRDVGESTVQGALTKREALLGAGAPPVPPPAGDRLPGLSAHPGLRWHLIGHLQRNKARKAVRLFTSIHSLDSVRLAAKLEEELAAREEEGGADDPDALLERLYLEINIAHQPTKSGIPPEGAAALLEEIRSLPRVFAKIDGLMGMPPHSEDAEAARTHFRRLRELRDRLSGSGLLRPGAGLSMGMSGDYPDAVEEGSTVVRVGSRLFEGIDEPGREPASPEEPRWPSS